MSGSGSDLCDAEQVAGISSRVAISGSVPQPHHSISLATLWLEVRLLMLRYSILVFSAVLVQFCLAFLQTATTATTAM